MSRLIFRYQITRGNISLSKLIQLRDFSIKFPANYSDEGDSSSSSDDEGKDSFCDLEGPCCQTLRVPPCSPVLMQKKPSSGKKVSFNA